jgi:hypothetical protein
VNAGAERMSEMVVTLAVAGEVLALLAVQLASARADEMPALAAEAKTTMGRIVKCCMDTAALEHLPPEDAATVRDELVSWDGLLRLNSPVLLSCAGPFLQAVARL